jgi:hypothetical protein
MHAEFNVHKQSVILHAECNFQTQCDFDTPECDYDTYKWDFNTHKSDFYTQSVMLTRISVIMNDTHESDNDQGRTGHCGNAAIAARLL